MPERLRRYTRFSPASHRMDILHQLDILAYRLLAGVWDLYWPALAAIGVLALIERRFAFEPRQPWRAWIFNIVWHAGLLAVAVGLSWTAWGEFIAWLGTLAHGAPQRLPAPVGQLDALARVAMALLAYDFFNYWAHRLQHAVPAFWVLHQFHHDERYLNAATSLRTHWLHIPFVQVLVLVPMMWVFGFDAVPAAAYSAYGVFAAFSHLNVNLSFGRFSKLLVSPQYHRIHHSRERRLHDRNLATILPLWDILFGTHAAPIPGERKPTGLSEIPASDSLLQVCLQPFVDWGRMLRRASTRA